MPCQAISMALLAIAALSAPAAATAQLVASPRNNFHAAVNGMASLCPSLVKGESVPDAAALAPFGLRPISSPRGEHRFQSLFNDGLLEVHFEPALHRCTVHYGGPGFGAIAGVARALASENGFARATGGDRADGTGEVFDRVGSEPAHRERYIIVEDPTSQTAAVSYSERTDS